MSALNKRKDNLKKKVTAVVLAAGQGRRMNMPVAKQFIMLGDKPVLYYSVKAFEDSHVDDIILVCGKGQVEYCQDKVVKSYELKKVKQIIEGGEERHDSVYLALQKIKASDYVLIHDGARPFISPLQINEVIDIVMESKACIVAAPVKDTIKIVTREGWIKETPNRDLMWSAQTPQAFEYRTIKKAYDLLYEKDKVERKDITDDSMVYEMFIGKPVKIVRGDYYNIKITTPEDIILAQGINQMRFNKE